MGIFEQVFSSVYAKLLDMPVGALHIGGVPVTATAADLNAGSGAIVITTQTGATYTFALVDAGTKVKFDRGSGQSATVPPDSDVDFPIGTQIEVQQAGAGQLTLVEGAGVTIDTPETLLMAKQNAAAVLTKDDANLWTLSGYLQAA